MVEQERWGELRETLEGFSGDVLSELCYILDLNRSGTIEKKIQRILNSDYEYEYAENRINFLMFGLNLLDCFSSRNLTRIIRNYDLPRLRTKWDKMIEIVKSEEVTPRALLGQLSTDDLEQIYYDQFEEEPTLDREGLNRVIIKSFGLEWLEEIMDSGFIMMAMKEDEDLEKTYQIIKEECEIFDINAVRIDEIASSGVINEEVLQKVAESEYIFVDLTHERPNVYYELGYCHGMDKSVDRIVLMAKKGTTLHFDIRNMRTILYENHRQLRKELGGRLRAIKKK